MDERLKTHRVCATSGQAKLETLHIPVESSFGTQFQFNFELEHHFEPNNLDGKSTAICHKDSEKLHPAPQCKTNALLVSRKTKILGEKIDFTEIWSLVPPCVKSPSTLGKVDLHLPEVDPKALSLVFQCGFELLFPNFAEVTISKRDLNTI